MISVSKTLFHHVDGELIEEGLAEFTEQQEQDMTPFSVHYNTLDAIARSGEALKQAAK